MDQKFIDTLAIKATECLNKHEAAYKAATKELGNIAAPIFTLAKSAYEGADKTQFKERLEAFTKACKAAETAYKEANGGKPVSELLPYWRVVKSEVVRGLKLGMNPAGHASYTAFLKARKKATPPSGAPGKDAGTPRSNTVTLAEALTRALAQLVKNCSGLTVAQQDILAVWISANMTPDHLEKLAPMPTEAVDNVQIPVRDVEVIEEAA